MNLRNAAIIHLRAAVLRFFFAPKSRNHPLQNRFFKRPNKLSSAESRIVNDMGQIRRNLIAVACLRQMFESLNTASGVLLARLSRNSF